MAFDPVCHMKIEPENAAGKSEFGGNTVYFCSDYCKEVFDKEPQKYPLEHAEHEHVGHGQHDSVSDVMHVCPMHPDIKIMGPGLHVRLAEWDWNRLSLCS